jgi:hypothetical protein
MNGNIKNIISQRFGRLIVVDITDQRIGGSVVWLCRCDCGNEAKASGGNLKGKHVMSCGCLRQEILERQRQPTHGMTKTRPYRIWQGMLARCEKIQDKDYRNYGGRGIKISEDWHDFENFWRDVEEGYSKGLSIDRIDNNGNYERGNIKWSSQKEQGNNTRFNKIVEHKGRKQTLQQWSDELGFSGKVLGYRLRSGWSIERALETPIKIYKKKI